MIRISLKNLAAGFADNEACLEWLKYQRYPHGIECPVCRKITKHHKVSKSPCYACDSCGHHIYPAAGTIFSKSSTPLTTWFKIISKVYSAKGSVSAREVQREFGVTYKTAWRMVKRVEGLLKENSFTGIPGILSEKSTLRDAAVDKAETGAEAISVNTTEDAFRYSNRHLDVSLPRSIPIKRKILRTIIGRETAPPAC